MVNLDDIRAARGRIQDAIFVSPCAYSENFSRTARNAVFFKLENLQMTGSFKERGALNKLLQLTAEERKRGVVCASAGNHAQGVAYHATRLGIAVTVVMPLTAPLTKVTATRRYGAEVRLHGANYDEAFAEATRLAAAHELTYIHAFNDDAIIAGQGTIGLELMEQVPDLEAVVVPVGGGGLMGGIAIAVKALNPQVRMVGVQTARVASMRAALEAHQPVTVPPATTIADGIGVRRVGERNLEIAEKLMDEYVTVEEEEIASAILMLLEREKTVAEGAGAAGVAALLEQKTSLVGRRVACLICGGNIDPIFLTRIVERGLVKDGRLVRVRLQAADYPGVLHAVTGIFTKLRVNVMHIEHERAYFGVRLGNTVMDFTLETRGAEHVAELLASLTEAGYQFERIT
ncbi:MAG: threonine ammonia-lyase [Bryobacteraceae bacterium]|nr:threonine ammonia-lyase [Bryobacteraceae bacterium]